MSRPTGAHRIGTYSTDCKCRRRHFRSFKDAKAHMLGCLAAGAVLYCPQVGEPIEVLKKVFCDGG